MANEKTTGLGAITSLADDDLLMVVDVSDTTMGASGTNKRITKANAITGGTPEGTAILSTGETGGTKFLREDGDGTCSWQDGGSASSPLTTKGDVYGYSTEDARLAVGTNGQVLTADSSEATGLKWADAGGGASGASRMYTYAEEGVMTTGLKLAIPIAEVFTAGSVVISSSELPTGSDIEIDVRKNGNTTTDSIFTSDTPISITTSDSISNGLYKALKSGIDNGNFGYGDTLYVTVTQVGSTVAGADLKVFIFDNDVTPTGGVYGFFGGGNAGSVQSVIDYITLAVTTQNATDTGDLTVARRGIAGASGGTYGFFGGGYTSSASNIIDYIVLAINTQNATDVGDLTVARENAAAVSGSTYGFWAGGDTIDYITLAVTTQNATDTGDLTVARGSLAGVSGSTYGFFGGGYPASSVIDYITLAVTTQNATDTGDLTVARYNPAGASGSTYGFFAGGANVSDANQNIIDHITLATTTQNATDTGDLTVARQLAAGISNETYCFFGGGYAGASTNIIEYINPATTTGNAADVGDLTVARESAGGVS